MNCEGLGSIVLRLFGLTTALEDEALKTNPRECHVAVVVISALLHVFSQ